MGKTEGRKQEGGKEASLSCFSAQLLPFFLHVEGGCASTPQPSSWVLESIPITQGFTIAQGMPTSTKGTKR